MTQRVGAIMERQARVLIVDDHPVVRQGLASLIGLEADLTVCGQAEDAYQALEALGNADPDVATVDLSLNGMSGIDLIKNIKVRAPQLPILVVSLYDESVYTERSLRAGALGYVMKSEAIEKLVQGIRRVLEGRVFVSEKMDSALLSKFVIGRRDEKGSSLDLLSDRELEVFQLVGKGYGTRDIAGKLYLSVKTVEAYRAHIKEKLNLSNSTELLQHAIRWAHDA